MTDDERTAKDTAPSKIALALAATLGAFALILTTVIGAAQTGLPRAPWAIGLGDLAFVALVAVFCFNLDHYLDLTDRSPILRGHRKTSILLTAVLLGAIAGVLGGLASSADQRQTIGARARYEGELRSIFVDIRKTAAEAYSDPASSRTASEYAESAQELGEAFESASFLLGNVQSRPDDSRLHLQLIRGLDTIADAYANLAALVVDSSATRLQVESARQEVKDSFGELRATEQVLTERGYRLTYPAEDKR